MGQRHMLFVLISLVLGMSVVGCWQHSPIPATSFTDIQQIVPDSLFKKANRGREVFLPDGRFNLPKSVRRVVVDVGAHHLETTAHLVSMHPDVAIIGIEPLAECWDKWPKSNRVIAIPVAIFTKRGHMEFNVNAFDETSALGKSVTTSDSMLNVLMQTVEVRKVPVLLLEDVLVRVPDGLEISFLKIDVQGVEFDVIKSAGEQLRRVYKMRVEVINKKLYEGVDEQKPVTEEDITAYMQTIDFSFLRDVGVVKDRWWLDKEYINAKYSSGLGRLWHRLRFGGDLNLVVR